MKRASTATVKKHHDPSARQTFSEVPWNIFDAGWVLLLTLLIPASIYLIIGIFVNLGWLPHELRAFLFGDTPLSQTISYTVSLAVELGLLHIVMRRYKLGWDSFGWRGFGIWRALRLIVLFYIGFLVVIGLVFAGIHWLLPHLNLDQAQSTGFETATTTPQRIAGFIVIVLAAPALEETYFRGFLFPALARRMHPVWAAISSSIIFGFLHFQANVSIYTFVLALFLCLLYYKLRSVVPGVVLHALNNFVAFLVMFKIW